MGSSCENEILNKNELFFLNTTINVNDNALIQLQTSIKTIWITQLTNENKEWVWEYLQLFVKLGDHVNKL